ncbi:MAG: pseudouridine synthase [Candidatus Thermoplasmatota archaeon]|nr:pseudouridine synthase [Candidatus Thermoplasmatota archaeon]
MRLQAYLSRCGKGSRRRCEDLIVQGRVSVNGDVVDRQGFDVGEGDIVQLDGEEVHPVPYRYYILNKPKGWISVDRDPRGRPYVVDLIPGAREQGCFPVGRLDMDTTGLLIVTNDGSTANRIAHPRYGVAKTYTATIKGKGKANSIHTMEKGVRIDDGHIVRDVRIDDISEKDGHTMVRLTIHEGKRHVVKRMFRSIGLKLEELERNAIGSLEIAGLGFGEWREISLDGIERACPEQYDVEDHRS